MRPWRSWIARQTPTLKAAGSNPVGRTTCKEALEFRVPLCFYQSEVMNYGETHHRGNAPVGRGKEIILK